jgi:putative ABC transport system permease protein
MFRNYLVTALRNLVHHMLYSFINIAGLAVGLACVIFIILFVRDELTFDSWLPGTENLYRLEITGHLPGRPPLEMATTPFPMPAAMKDQIPEVTAMTRLVPEAITIMVGDRQFFDTVAVVDPNFLSVIRLPLVAGDPTKVLRQPQSIVLSQTLARKYFGNADPTGKTVTVSNTNCAVGDESCLSKPITLTVTGILRDLSHNTQLQADALMPNTSLADRITVETKQKWTAFNGYGYVALAPGAYPRTILTKMSPILDRSLATEMKLLNLPGRGKDLYDIHLTPFVKVHLSSKQYQQFMTPAGSWTTVYGVALIGVLILLVACCNYMNLATAQALQRAREIGLRKCLGASRGTLIVQFLSESVLMSLVAIIIALALVEILLSGFDNFLGRPLAIDYLRDWPLLFCIAAIAIFAGLISGSYPALVMSGFRPAETLRASATGQTSSGRLRLVLVVLQFAVSIGLGIAMTVVFSQIRYARDADLGFQRDRMMILAGAARLTPVERQSFAHALLANPGVLDVSLSNMVPFGNNQNMGMAQVPGSSGRIGMNRISIDPDFTRVYRIALVAGRTFTRARSEDGFIDDPTSANEGHNVVVNVSGAARLGLTPPQAVDKTIIFNTVHVRIVGVLPDIKFDGAREPVKPTIYYNDKNQNSIRLRGDGITDTVTFIDRTWRGIAPSTSSHRYFLDESFDKLYLADQRQGRMFGAFVAIAIFIACLGLFGLAAFTAGRRTKEIGIRRVFGARTRDVLFLLLWQFSIPVLAANVIAWPLAWYYLHGWLQGFAYRITLSPLYFLGAGLVALLIAWTTILAHALRVARANPIHALRTE